MKFKSDNQRRAMFANLSNMFSNARRGERFEQKIHARLGRSNSIVTMRSSGSRGLWDMIAITPDKVRLVQAKTHGYIEPDEREEMLDQLQRMPDNIQAELEYYVSPRVTKNFTLKKAGEDDWEKVEERLEHFAKVRGYRKIASVDDESSMSFKPSNESDVRDDLARVNDKTIDLMIEAEKINTERCNNDINNLRNMVLYNPTGKPKRFVESIYAGENDDI